MKLRSVMRRMLLVGCLLGAALADCAFARTPDEPVDVLIRRLGDEKYYVRKRARDALTELGDAAFDQLSAAQNDSDPEIAAQARYLLRQVRIDWVKDADPAEVQAILRGYDRNDEAVRRAKIRQLSELFSCQGGVALCRLARFEQSEALSKEAALAVIQLRPLAGPTPWNELAPSIHQEVSQSKRPAATWVQAFLLSIDEPDRALQQLGQSIDVELRVLAEHPPQTSPLLIDGLYREQARLLRRLNRNAEANVALEATVSLSSSEPAALVDLMDRLIENDGWSAIELAAQSNAALFDGNALLTYLHARAQQLQGKGALAEQTAQKAFSLDEDIEEHREAARQLRLRGLAEWENRETRYIIDKAPASSEMALTCRYLLAENLYDDQNYAAAADTCEAMLAIIDAAPNNNGFRGERINSMRSRMHFFRACAHDAAGNRAEQIAEYRRGIEHDPKDGDILIGMYRWSAGDAEERKKVMALIDQAAAGFREEIQQSPELSVDYNQLAWLIGNTEGDFDEAIRLSQKSIELLRGESMYIGIPMSIAGYLDTLAHCYAGKRDFENAIKHQAEASRLDPGSKQIARKLAVFRQRLAEQTKSQ